MFSASCACFFLLAAAERERMFFGSLCSVLLLCSIYKKAPHCQFIYYIQRNYTIYVFFLYYDRVQSPASKLLTATIQMRYITLSLLLFLMGGMRDVRAQVGCDTLVLDPSGTVYLAALCLLWCAASHCTHHCRVTRLCPVRSR